MPRNLIAPLLSTLLATTASAHPGHGAGTSGLAHYLTEPLHVVAALVLCAVLLAAGSTWRASRKRRRAVRRSR